jgi:methylisocitrate lyase
MHRYLEAGADMAFVEAPQDAEQMRRITREIAAPNMANMVPGGRTPLLTEVELEQLGFAMVAHPTALTYMLARSAQCLLECLRANGTTAPLESEMMAFAEFNEVVGLEQIRAMEHRLNRTE